MMIGLHHHHQQQQLLQKQQQQLPVANIVRIQAKTALPFVSSVPKCRRTKASRPHPLDTVNGCHSPSMVSGNSLSPMLISHKQATRMPHRVSSRESDERVLLIVNDDHINGGGVPVLGRRLPSKSAGSQSRHHRDQEFPQEQYEQLPLTFVPKQQPVVGRRSHRLLLQMQPPSSAYSMQPLSIVEAASCEVLSTRLTVCSEGGVNERKQKQLMLEQQRRHCYHKQETSACCSPIAEPVCREPCCFVVPANRSLFRSASCQRLPCCNANSHPPAPPPKPDPDFIRQAVVNHHHSSCQANADPTTLNSSSRRSSSCHNRGPRQVSVDLPPQSEQQQQQEGPELVTQMYESLAAELKAKLGDPKKGPILLPPKDYDTISRKQGKLTGIEMRRSTNPQLVGPTANFRQISNQNTGNIGSVASMSCEPADAGRLSCVSIEGQIEAEVMTQQRSRSNSSSGLGSISISGDSPNSSPSSKSCSSEDMRKPTTVMQPHQQQGKTGPFNDSNSSSGYSPDNCASSDSGSSNHHLQHRRCLSQQSSASIRKIQESRDSLVFSGTQRSTDRAFKQADGGERAQRGVGIHNHNPSKISDGVLWNGRVEIPLKVNNNSKNGNTYLATKQIIY